MYLSKKLSLQIVSVVGVSSGVSVARKRDEERARENIVEQREERAANVGFPPFAYKRMQFTHE